MTQPSLYHESVTVGFFCPNKNKPGRLLSLTGCTAAEQTSSQQTSGKLYNPQHEPHNLQLVQERRRGWHVLFVVFKSRRGWYVVVLGACRRVAQAAVAVKVTEIVARGQHGATAHMASAHPNAAHAELAAPYWRSVMPADQSGRAFAQPSSASAAQGQRALERRLDAPLARVRLHRSCSFSPRLALTLPRRPGRDAALLALPAAADGGLHSEPLRHVGLAATLLDPRTRHAAAVCIRAATIGDRESCTSS